MRLCVDQILIYRVTISHNPRLRIGTELCTSMQPSFRTPSSATFFASTSQQLRWWHSGLRKSAWSTLAFSLMVQSNPSSQGMSSRVQLRLHYPQQCPRWHTALLKCWTKAALVGRILVVSIVSLSSRTTPTRLRRCRSSCLCGHKAGLWSVPAQQRYNVLIRNMFCTSGQSQERCCDITIPLPHIPDRCCSPSNKWTHFVTTSVCMKQW